MLEFQEKRKVKKFIYSKLTLVILVIVIFFVLRGVWSVYQKEQYTRDNLNKTAQDLQGLKDREQMLSTEIDRLKTQSGTEAEIRDKYGLVKPGEEVIVIVDKNTDASNTDATSGDSFWQKMLDWLQ